MASEHLSSPMSQGEEQRNPVLAMLEGSPHTSSSADALFSILREVFVTTVNDLKVYARTEFKDVDELQAYVFDNLFRFQTDYNEVQQRALAMKFSTFVWESFRKENDTRRQGVEHLQQSCASTRSTFNIKRKRTTFHITEPAV